MHIIECYSKNRIVLLVVYMDKIKDIYTTCKKCGYICHEETKLFDPEDWFCINCYCKGEFRYSTAEEIEKCKQEDQEYEERRMQRKLDEIFNPTYTPKCPVCGSPNIHKISVTKRVVSGAAFGLFSKTARSQWECSNCGNKW